MTVDHHLSAVSHGYEDQCPIGLHLAIEQSGRAR